MRNLTTIPHLSRLSATLMIAATVAASAQAAPRHFRNAEKLAMNLRIQGEAGYFNLPDGTPLNLYGGSWPNVGFTMASPARAYARCSSFLTLVLMYSYPGWTPQAAGFASASPTAAIYHDAIEAKACGFKRVSKFSSIRQGDILAVKYSDPDDDTGHIMIVRNFQAGVANANGIVPWQVEVIDCSKNAHSQDTRTFSLGGGTTVATSGVGAGTMCVYTQNDKIVGYSWSLSNGSTIYNQSQRHMTLGRFTLP